MHNRFIKKGGQSRVFLSVILSVFVFFALLWLLNAGVGALSKKTLAEQQKSTERAVTQAAVHCYALEGAYPESLDYLKDHYGLTIDETHFSVQYVCFASNLMPQIDVVPK